MKSWEVLLLNKLYKTSEGFRPLENLFLTEKINFDHARNEIIKIYNNFAKVSDTNHAQTLYTDNFSETNKQQLPSLEHQQILPIAPNKDTLLLNDMTIKKNIDDELFPLSAQEKLKELESTLNKPIIQTGDDVGTLLNICTYLTEKEQIQHSFSFVQILNDIKTKNERFFISKGLEYVDVLVFSALGRCKSWKKISREAKNSLPSLYSWFEGIKNEHQELTGFYVHPSLQSKKDQKMTQHKQLLKHHHPQFIETVQQKNPIEAEKFLASDVSTECINSENRKTACHIACENGDIQMIKLLDKYGCNFEAVDIEDMTPIFYALASENIEVIEYLIARGVNLEHGDNQLRTPFYWACSKCSLPIIKYLYSKDCNISTMSKMQRSPLSKAAYMGRVEVVDFLLSCKESQVNETGEKGRTALHMAVWGKMGGRHGKKVGHTDTEDSPEIALLLLKNGADVNLKDAEGNTALNTAAASFSEMSIPILISFGAEVNTQNNFGETPLYKASQKGYLEICKILLENHKADPFIKSETKLDCLEVSIINQNYQVTLFYLGQLDKKLNQDDEYFDNISRIIAVNYKEDEASFLLLKLFRNRDIPTKIFLTSKTIEKIMSLKNSEILDILTKWLKSAFNQGNEINAQEKIKDILDTAFKIKWVYCLTFLLSLFNKEISQLTWKATDLNLDFDSQELFYILRNFNIDIFSQNERDENIIHLLVKSKNTKLLSSISQLLNLVLQEVQTLQTKDTLQNIYLIDLDYSTIASFFTAKDINGYSASELALLNKYYDVSTILEQMMKQNGQKFENLFKIPSYKLEVNRENLNTPHKYKEKLLDIESKLIVDGNDMNNSHLSGLIWPSRVKPEELDYLKRVCDIDSKTIKAASHNPFVKLISERPVVFVEDELGLQKACEKLRHASIIGVDMECFGDEQLKVTFVCLLQISTVNEDYLIDCIRLHKLISQHLQPVFAAEEIQKIFHGCDNDLKWLKSNFDIDVINIFDTCKAYMLMNSETTSVSLAFLTIELLGFELNKSYQKSDWRVRPLPKAMLDYARNDSCILLYLWFVWFKELQGKENKTQIELQMVQKMIEKCWKTLESNSLPKVSLEFVS